MLEHPGSPGTSPARPLGGGEAQDPVDGLGQRAGVAGWGERPPRVAHHLRQPNLVARYHGHLHGQRLLDHDRHGVAVPVRCHDARRHEQVGLLEERAHVILRPRPGPLHDPFQPQALRVVTEVGPERPLAYDHQPIEAVPPPQQRRRVEQVAKALLLDQPAHRDHGPPARVGGATEEALAVHAHHDPLYAHCVLGSDSSP